MPKASKSTWVLIAVVVVQVAVTLTVLTWRSGPSLHTPRPDMPGTLFGESADSATGRGEGIPPNTHRVPPRSGRQGRVSVPRWALEKASDDNGCLRLHEVFDVDHGRGKIAWPASRMQHLIIPEVKPAGWTPVAPLVFDCPALHWFNKPGVRRVGINRSGGNLVIQAERHSGFWQDRGVAQGGSSSDGGHFLHIELKQVPGEVLVVTGRFALAARHSGDKVGLMLRRGRSAWVLAALTHDDTGAGLVSTVVTNDGFSDWAPAPCGSPHRCEEVSLRLSIQGDAVVIEANDSPDEDGGMWHTLRVATLHDRGEEEEKHEISIGTFASAPGPDGMEAFVGYFSISAYSNKSFVPVPQVRF